MLDTNEGFSWGRWQAAQNGGGTTGMPRHTVGIVAAALAGALIATTAGVREEPAPTCPTSDSVATAYDIPPGDWRAAAAAAPDAVQAVPADVQTCTAAHPDTAGLPGAWLALLLGLIVLGLVVLAAVVPEVLSQRRASVSITVAAGGTLVVGSAEVIPGADAAASNRDALEEAYADGWVTGIAGRPPQEPASGRRRLWLVK